MNKLKFAFALLALMASGQIMAWTRVLNYTSYPIKFRAALRGGDINEDWMKSPTIPPIRKDKNGRAIPGEFFTHEGAMNLRFRYDIFADMGAGFTQVLDDPVNNEGGNRQLSVYRTDDGEWYITSQVRGAD